MEIEEQQKLVDEELRKEFEWMTPEQYEEFKRRYISEMLRRSGAVRSIFPRKRWDAPVYPFKKVLSYDK